MSKSPSRILNSSGQSPYRNTTKARLDNKAFEMIKIINNSGRKSNNFIQDSSQRVREYRKSIDRIRSSSKKSISGNSSSKYTVGKSDAIEQANISNNNPRNTFTSEFLQRTSYMKNGFIG